MTFVNISLTLIWPVTVSRFSLLLVKKVDFQATEMALCAAFLQYNNKKGFALLNFGQICSVNHQNLVISRSKTVGIVVEVSC